LNTIISARGISKRFGEFTALDDVSFTLDRGQTIGIVGESGSGKSTLGRIIMRLLAPDAGMVELAGEDLFSLGRSELRVRRKRIQLVPQDPRTSLNPTMTIRQNLYFQLRAQRMARAGWEQTVESLLDQVSLPVDYLNAFPHELSGGQAQRVAIARALANSPDVLVCDEAVSALDKSVQAQVLNTLAELQSRTGVAIFFISHDLAVVEHISDTVLVLNRGVAVEQGKTREVLANPRDEYTRELLTAKSPHIASHTG
jgi:ABC-type glutathione transport system ATPase component